MRFSTSSACGLVALLISSSPLIWANPVPVPVPVPSHFALAPAASEVAPSPPPEVAATAVPAALNGRSTIVKRNYAGSCRLCALGSSNANILSCICRRADQSEILSTLNLNNCLGNSDGHLQWWRNGGFGGSCNSYGLVGTSFGANCRNNAGNWGYTGVPLSDRIENWNGVLGCSV